MKFKKTNPVKKTVAEEIINDVIILVDNSGSMYGQTRKAMEGVNKVLQEFRNSNLSKTSKVFVTIMSFNDFVVPFIVRVPLNEVGELDVDSLNVTGTTALNDAIIQGISRINIDSKKNHSAIMYVITDGAENSSGRTCEDTEKLIREKIKSDRWTFAFSGPYGCKDQINKIYGIERDSIQEWNHKDIEKMSKANAQVASTYMQVRASGAASLRSVYAPTTSHIKKKELPHTFDNVTSKFDALSVGNSDPLSVSDYVRAKVGQFQKGIAFYQLTKKEKVQSYKEIVIRDKVNNRLYTGPEVRKELGIPEGGSIELNPGSDPRFDIFVLSTSNNRKLVPGTNVLIRRNAK